jgi:hypothetical protein
VIQGQPGQKFTDTSSKKLGCGDAIPAMVGSISSKIVVQTGPARDPISKITKPKRAGV